MSLAGVDLTIRYLRALFRDVYRSLFRLYDFELWNIKLYARYLRRMSLKVATLNVLFKQMYR